MPKWWAYKAVVRGEKREEWREKKMTVHSANEKVDDCFAICDSQAFVSFNLVKQYCHLEAMIILASVLDVSFRNACVMLQEFSADSRRR